MALGNHDPPDRVQHGGAGGVAVGAQVELQRRGVGNDVALGAGMDAADGEHRGLGRRHFAGHTGGPGAAHLRCASCANWCATERSWSRSAPGSRPGCTVLAKQGLHIPVTDLFGPAGRVELAAAPLDRAYRARVSLDQHGPVASEGLDSHAGPVCGATTGAERPPCRTSAPTGADCAQRRPTVIRNLSGTHT